MRVRTAFTVVLLGGLACLGVPSAAADELLPSPAGISEGDASVAANVSAPTPDPSSVEAAPAQPAAEETEDAAQGTTSEPVEAPDPTEAAEEPDNTQPAEDGEATGAADESVPQPSAEAAAAQLDARDPRASIGDVNCTDLTIPVTLDNTRSTEAVIYEVSAGDADGDGPTFEETVRVAAGATRVMSVQATEDIQFAVYVVEPPREDFLPEITLAFAVVSVNCTADDESHDPQARIGGLDCAHLTLDVTLDNSRSADGTTYLVTAINLPDEEPTYEQTFNVAAGAVQTVPVPVTENSTVGVTVSDEDALEETDGEEGDLALELFRVDCTPGDGPRADIGEVNCPNLTVPVTLDNTLSTVETTFVVLAGDPGDEGFFDYEKYFAVAAGAQRVTSVPVPNNAEVAVVAADGERFFGLGDTFTYKTLTVDCERAPAGRAVPRFVVGAGALAATGANGQTLPLAGLMLVAIGGVLTRLGRRSQVSTSR